KQHTFSATGERSSATVLAPFCQMHRSHWQARYVIIGIGIWTWLISVIAGLYFVPRQDWNLVYIFAGIGLAAWFGMMLYLELSAIRLKNVSAQLIELSGIAEEFIEALRVHRESRDGSELSGDRSALTRVRLTRGEAESGDLPDVCVFCGEPATA